MLTSNTLHIERIDYLENNIPDIHSDYGVNNIPLLIMSAIYTWSGSIF